MGVDQIMQMLNGKTEIKLVKFISDKGPNSCKECLKHHGEVFRADDPNKPKLPIHPNCRCKYELLPPKGVVRYQENVKKIESQLINYGIQIAAQATQLLAKCEKEINGYIANTAVAAIPIAYRPMNALESAKTKVNSTVTSAKISAMLATLKVSYWAMKKIDQADKFLQRKMESTGISTALNKLKPWLSPMQKMENPLKKWHYDRLNNPMQQPWALPQSPEEAMERGFVRAPDNQNLYHRNKGQKDNVKFHHPKTGQEVIFNGQGKIVTDIENIGTYNYFPVSEKINNLFDIVNAALHMVVDVIPYYEWGNGPDDLTPFPERVAGPESGGKITSQIRNLFLTEDSIEKEQKEIDEFFQKYRKIIKD